MDDQRSVTVDLDDRERAFLRAALLDWGGPARPTQEFAVAMGFASVEQLSSDTRSLWRRIDRESALSIEDWRRVLCTLDASWTYLPHLSRRRLADCCWASGVQLYDAHSALGDARATAALLASYLNPNLGRPPTHEHLSWKTSRCHQRLKPVIAVPSINSNNRSIYFLPDRALVRQGKEYAELPYASLQATATPQRFIEDGPPPTDSQVVGWTWQYANTKGAQIGASRTTANCRSCCTDG